MTFTAVICSLFVIIPALGIIENAEPCHSWGGICMLAADCKDAASTQCNWCLNQPENVRCCLAYQEATCSAAGGLCKRNDKSCMGQNLSGKCLTQHNDIECCIEGGNGNDSFEYDYASRYVPF